MDTVKSRIRKRPFFVAIVAANCSVILYILATNNEPLHDTTGIFHHQSSDSVHPFMKYLQWLSSSTSSQSGSVTVFNDYNEALAATANEQNVVVLVPMDSGVLDMAMNLFYTSLKPFGILNHLYLSTDAAGCDGASVRGVRGCHVYTSDADAGNSSAFGSSAWRRKVNYKNDMIKNALKKGYNVLLVDVDIVFLKHPLSHVMDGLHHVTAQNHVAGNENHVTTAFDHVTGSKNVMTTDEPWDIVAQWDGYGFNTGFLLVKSNQKTKKFYAAIRQILIQYPKLTDQQAFNRALDVSGVPVIVKCLPVDLFMHGLTYFTAGRRQFADDDPCSSCVLVHNNYIVGMDHKRYRFQEMLLWWNDEKQYYSSTTRKYLSFDIAARTPKRKQETMLAMALDICTKLNRTLILPKFYDGQHQTTLAHLVDVNSFGRVHQYRESVFLLHPLVPDSVKRSVLEVSELKSDVAASVLHVNNLKGIAVVEK